MTHIFLTKLILFSRSHSALLFPQREVLNRGPLWANVFLSLDTRWLWLSWFLCLTETLWLAGVGARVYIIFQCSHVPDVNPCDPLLAVNTCELLTPTRCCLLIGRGLHPRKACFSLDMVYIHAMLVLHWSLLSLMHSLFPVIILLILSTARCICQQHSPGSLQVTVIYYISYFYNCYHFRS